MKLDKSDYNNKYSKIMIQINGGNNTNKSLRKYFGMSQQAMQKYLNNAIKKDLIRIKKLGNKGRGHFTIYCIKEVKKE